MTEIQIYKSGILAEQALERYCNSNKDNNRLLVERISANSRRIKQSPEFLAYAFDRKTSRIPIKPELIALPENLRNEAFANTGEDLCFRFLFGLYGGGNDYSASIGFEQVLTDLLRGHNSSVEELVKEVHQVLNIQHERYGKTGITILPVFYTIEKESGVLKKIERIQALRGEDASLLEAAFLDLSFVSGLNAEERTEFVKLWDLSDT